MSTSRVWLCRIASLLCRASVIPIPPRLSQSQLTHFLKVFMWLGVVNAEHSQRVNIGSVDDAHRLAIVWKDRISWLGSGDFVKSWLGLIDSED